MPGRWIHLCLPAAALFAIGCGGGDGADPPRDRADASVLHCPAAPHALFEIYARPEIPRFNGSYDDVSWPTTVEEKVREGECAFFGPEPPFCDRECQGDTICATGGDCRGFPHPIAIGTVRVTGTDPELILEPDQNNTYKAGADLPGLYGPGDELTLTADGADGHAALSLTVRGVPPLAVEPDQLTAREHDDLVVTWTADPSSPEGTELILHADSDHHGIEAYVECRAADDGELVIPAAVLDPLILAGESGIGNYIENAWMKRINQATTDTDLGCAAFQTSSEVSITIDTVRDD